MITFWIAAIIIFVVAEVASVNLLTIWFACGSLVALLAAALGAKLWLQVLLFLVVSVGILALLRPFAKKYVNSRKKPTNADRVLGMICIVTEDIDNIAGTGAVTVGGKVWTARTADGSKLPAGSYVRPISIQGVKLIVEKVEQKAPQNQ